MRNTLFIFVLLSFLTFGFLALAQENDLPSVGLTPDSHFYFLKSWKESIQTFFTFGEQSKAKQFLHLADVRLSEYQKMIEKGKTEIAQKTLDKYKEQLNRALEKTEEAKEKGRDVEKLKETIGEKILKHQQILEGVLEKVPEEAKEGIEKAIEASQKGFQKIITKEEKIYKNDKYKYEVRYPKTWWAYQFNDSPSTTIISTLPKNAQIPKEGEYGMITISYTVAMSLDYFRQNLEDKGKNIENVKIGTIEGYKVIAPFREKPVSESSPLLSTLWFFKAKNGEGIYQIFGEWGSENWEFYEATINKIISTFRFLEDSSEKIMGSAENTESEKEKTEVTASKTILECENKSTELDKNLCYAQKAEDTLDETLCIFAGNGQDFCYLNIAEEGWNSGKSRRETICNAITDNLLKCDCLVRVNNQKEYETCKAYIPMEIDAANYSKFLANLAECVVSQGKTVSKCKEISIPSETAARQTRDKKRIADINLFATALELYYSDHDAYPILKDDSRDGEFLKILNQYTGGIIYLDPLNPQYYYSYQGDSGQSYILTAQCEIVGEECDMKDAKQDGIYRKERK